MKNIKNTRGSVYCGSESWTILNDLIHNLSPSKTFVITDANTFKYCYQKLEDAVPETMPLYNISIAAGETNKTVETCQMVWQKLSDLGADRKSLIINLGGGVVTDLGGFVACTFRRGIEFINIPTSLLAMVDASVGGKNGVDLGHIKNQIGVIRTPLAVIVDHRFLATLPGPHLNSGYAEMLKHGLIASESYWDSLINIDFKDPEHLEELIWKSIEIKNKVVSEDPNELGLRKTLNYGHTLGHAIESYFLEEENRMPLLHGEAIAIGMILANYISNVLIGFPEEKLANTTKHILSRFPKVDFRKNEIASIIELLKFDKKNVGDNINFVLLEDFGKYKFDRQVPNNLIYNAFEYYKNFII